MDELSQDHLPQPVPPPTSSSTPPEPQTTLQNPPVADKEVSDSFVLKPDNANPLPDQTSSSPPPSEPQTFSPVNISPSVSKKKYLFLGLIVVLVIVAGVSFLFLKKRSPQEKNNLTPANPQSEKASGKERKYYPETLTPFTKEELQKLGIVTLPVGFEVQEEYRGIKFTKSPKRNFTANELALLKRFLDLTPAKLLTPGPAAVVTFSDDEVDTGFFGTGLSTVAFASGSYLFFDENSFKSGTLGVLIGDTSVDQAFYAFEHELVHVAQFNQIQSELDQSILTQLEESRTTWMDIALKNNLFSEFALVAGWQKGPDPEEPEKEKYLLQNKELALTTEYGKTDIAEDMAETVSGTVLTRFHEYSPERKAWALKFLNETENNLKSGKFPSSSLFVPVKAFFVTFDYQKEDEYKEKYSLVDRQVFVDDNANSLEEVKNYLASELAARGWSGIFTKEVKEDKVEIYKGDFLGNKRDMYVELRTYDNAEGYSEKPVGTQIVVVNGYNL